MIEISIFTLVSLVVVVVFGIGMAFFYANEADRWRNIRRK